MTATRPLPQDDINHVWNHTKDLWSSLQRKSIFITGGTGFFGIWLIETLIAANTIGNLELQIVVLSRDPTSFLAKMPHIASCSSIKWIKGDICNFTFPDGAFDYVVHAATETSNRLTSNDKTTELHSMIEGTKRVLEFARASGVIKMLFTSSGAVYGPHHGAILGMKEDCVISLDSMDSSASYAIGKRVSEHLCWLHSLSSGCQISIARCFAFVGPHLPLDQNYAIGNFIRDGLNGKPLQITGNGRAIRSYLHAADLMIWLWTILFRSKGCRAYNVGSSNSISIANLAREVATAMGQTLPIPISSQLRDDNTSVYVPDVDRAFNELGLQQHISLPEAIRRTVNWYYLQHTHESL